MATPETTADRPAFDIDKAYNTKGFLEFLSQHPDAEIFDSKDSGAVEERMKTFETQTAVAKGVFEAFNGHVKRELGIEIDSAEAREEIEAYILAKAVEDPAEVARMRETLQQSADLKAGIAELETMLSAAGKSADHASAFDAGMDQLKDLHTADAASGLIGGAVHAFNRFRAFLAPITGWKGAEAVRQTSEAKARVDQLYNNPDGAARERLIAETAQKLGEIKAKLEKSKTIEDKLAIASRDFDALRQTILASTKDSEELSDMLQKAVSERFKEITAKSSLQDLIKAQERLQALTDDNATGVDLFEGKSAAEIQGLIDERIEKKANEMVKEAVKGIDISGGRALDRLKKEIDALIKAEQLGSKQGAEAKEIVRTALFEAADALKKASPENTAKRLVIRRIIDTL